MDLWLSVIDKKMAHPNEIQNTSLQYIINPLNPENLCANFAQNHNSRGLYFVRLSSTTIASLGTELEDGTWDDRRSCGKIRSCLIG